MTQFKNTKNRINNYIGLGKNRIIIGLVLIPIITAIEFVILTNNYKNSDYILSMGDFLLNTGDVIIFYINLVIIPCLIISVLTKMEFTVNSITRYSSKKDVFLKQFKLVFVIVVAVVLYQFLITTILGNIMTETNMNFSQTNSVFCFENQGKTATVSLLFVYAVTALFCFLSSLLFCTLHLMNKWLIGNDVVGFCILIFCFILDYAGKGICAFFGVGYEKWLPYNAINLILILLLIFIIFIIGAVASIRKEFLNAK